MRRRGRCLSSSCRTRHRQLTKSRRSPKALSVEAHRTDVNFFPLRRQSCWTQLTEMLRVLRFRCMHPWAWACLCVCECMHSNHSTRSISISGMCVSVSVAGQQTWLGVGACPPLGQDAARPSVGRPREGALCLWLCSMHVSMLMWLHACEFHEVVTWPSPAATARRQARRAAAAPVAQKNRASKRKRSVS